MVLDMRSVEKKIIIVGFGFLAKTIYYYLTRDGFQVESYLVENEYLEDSLDFPVYSIDKIKEYGNKDFLYIVAIAHVEMNRTRERIVDNLIAQGYNLINYISPNAITSGLEIVGSNNIIMDNVVIAPNTKIGYGNLFWPNSMISHDTEISSYSTFASGSTIAGNVVIGKNCFFGVNSSVNENLKINDFTLVGANVNIRNSTLPMDVYVNSCSKKIAKSSLDFFKR